MTKKKRLSSLVTAALVGLSLMGLGASNASAIPLSHGEWYLKGGYIGYHIHYKEHITPSDKDTGWLNGEYIKLGKIIQSCKVWSELKVSYATTGDNNGDYDGFSQNGAGYYSPFSSNTTEKILEIGGKGGIYQNLSKRFYAYEGLTLKYRYWRREIESGYDNNENYTMGYEEKYKTFALGAVAGIQYYPVENFSIGVEAEGLISPKHFSTVRVFGDTITMGKEYEYKIAVPIEWDITKNISLDVAGFYDHWRFDESNKDIVTVNGESIEVIEPSSTTKEYGTTVGLNIRFW